MSKMIIIAGPQAAGKSSVISSLSALNLNQAAPGNSEKAASLLFPMQESRQIIVHKHMLLGAIWMTEAEEREVITCDMERMDLILRRNEKQLKYLDECNVFTVAHARAHGIMEIDYCWDDYIKRLKALDAEIIFLDACPDISWARRRERYRQRLVYFPEDQHEEIMGKYRAYLESAYTALHEVYDRLPFSKRMIDASLSKEKILELVSGFWENERSE